MTVPEAIRLQQAVINILKKRFNNLSAKELAELAAQIVTEADAITTVNNRYSCDRSNLP